MPSHHRFIQWPACAMFAALVFSQAAQAQAPAQSQSRGEMLYSTHCIACHTAEIHWRDKSLVTDWPSLKTQVSRWQGVAMLGWSEADMLEVARYLNQIHYRFEAATIPLASAQRRRVP